MSPNTQRIVFDLENAADDNLAMWVSRRRRWQALMTEAARVLEDHALELDMRKRAEEAPLRVKAYSKIKSPGT